MVANLGIKIGIGVNLREWIGANVARLFTHPDIASLVHPLFAARKEGRGNYQEKRFINYQKVLLRCYSKRCECR